MPSSDPVTIPKVLQLVAALSPNTILDVGTGNGRYGFLFREVLDLNYGRLNPADWQTRIDGVEVEANYITPVHGWAYDKVFVADWSDFMPTTHYDLIFMGDVLEHFADWHSALYRARSNAKNVIVVAPNWRGSGAQGAWFDNEYEAHQVELTPAMVGGRCLFANSKCFITAFGEGIIQHRDILL